MLLEPQAKKHYGGVIGPSSEQKKPVKFVRKSGMLVLVHDRDVCCTTETLNKQIQEIKVSYNIQSNIKCRV